MPRFFFDTSSFAKYYHPKLGSSRVTEIFQLDEAVRQVSNLGMLETQTAFAMKVRTLQISQEDAAILRQRLSADVAAKVVNLILLESKQ